MLEDLKKEVKLSSDPEKATFLARFFKTGKGQYGENDVFLGITVPVSRKIAVKYKDLPFGDIKKLLESPYHEERLIALLILVYNFNKADESRRKEIVDFYLSHTQYINNWDLVDLSADKIVGEYLVRVSGVSSVSKVSRAVLFELAKSEDVWERRIAIISTYAFIKRGEHEETFAIADILLHDKHDLIQKAVGWMLREVGKRVSEEVEEDFLKSRYKTMPRTALRYAIERFPEDKRKQYLAGLL